MAENYLITGYWGEPHVTAENDRGINAAIFGTGRFVLPVGRQFHAEYIGNNTIRMYDGKLVDNGAAAGIPAGKYVDLLISEAGQGMNRNDLIVFQYKKDTNTLVESGSFVVVKGVETTGTAEDPALSQSDLLSDTATLDQMALWRVPVSVATISAPVKVFNVSHNLANAGGSTQIAAASSTDGVSYTATVDGVHSLYVGLSVTFIPDKGCETETPTLDLNGLGAKRIRRRISGNTALLTDGSSGWLVSGRPVHLTFNGTYWAADHIKPNANDLYGNVPIECGGTGADSLKEAQANMQIAPALEAANYPGCYVRVYNDDETRWIDPPMVTGVKYETIERFMNVPVYTAIVEGTVQSEGTSTRIKIDTGVTGCLRFEAYRIEAGTVNAIMPLERSVVSPEISTAILRAVVDNTNGALTEGAKIIVQAWYIKDSVDALI